MQVSWNPWLWLVGIKVLSPVSKQNDPLVYLEMETPLTMPLLISCACCKEFTQTEIKTTFYCLYCSEPVIPKSCSQRGYTPSRSSGGGKVSSLPLLALSGSKLSLAFIVLCIHHSNISFCLPVLSSSVSFQLSVPSILSFIRELAHSPIIHIDHLSES